MPAQSESDTGIRFGIGARFGSVGAVLAGALAADRADHAVEQLEHAVVGEEHRLGPSGGPRRELDQRRVGVLVGTARRDPVDALDRG